MSSDPIEVLRESVQELRALLAEMDPPRKPATGGRKMDADQLRHTLGNLESSLASLSAPKLHAEAQPASRFTSSDADRHRCGNCGQRIADHVPDEEGARCKREAVRQLRESLSAPKPRMVGCEGDDGLIRTHPEAETCDVCAPKPESAEAVAWLVEREGDPTFPRVFTREAVADNLLSVVRVGQRAVKRPLVYADTTPPRPEASAPVGVEGLVAEWRTTAARKRAHGSGVAVAEANGYDMAANGLERALAHQPAAVDEADKEGQA